MLYLLFQLDEDQYALAASQIAEVLPWIGIKRVPGAPPVLAGAIDYRGALVPVLDLSALLLGRRAHSRMSTRIVLVHYRVAPAFAPLLGLIAERANETCHFAAAAFRAAGVRAADAPYLGPVASGPRGLIQRLEVDALLTPALRDLLFASGAVA